MNDTLLKQYGEMAVKAGVNIQPGQTLIINAPITAADLVHHCATAAYDAGAREVVVNWSDEKLSRIKMDRTAQEVLCDVKPWIQESYLQYIKSEGSAAILSITGSDPEIYKGLDMQKINAASIAKMNALAEYRSYTMASRIQWCVIAVPTVGWAKKVFPELAEDEAVEKLWEAILSAARANGDAIANWQQHNKRIHELTAKLNKYNFKSLVYKSANGTDFKVGLMKEGIFAGAEETDLSGRGFNPNIPSEEIFTSPKKGEAEGVLVATKPLSWQGSLIEDFSIRFENGKAVEVKAAKGQDALERMIAMDENAPYLGECALIPYESPINQLGILFYSTLYDENACCHLALGRGFDVCVKDYEKYTKDELKELGINDSMIQVDFMIGADDMTITGYKDGKATPIFVNGTWAE
jgi:aminopeptidase